MVPLGGSPIAYVTTLAFGTDAVVVWAESFPYGNDRLHAARVDGAGAAVWTVELATSPSGNSRVEGSLSTRALSPTSGRGGTSATVDVMAQNLNTDGTLGHPVPVELQSFSVR